MYKIIIHQWIDINRASHLSYFAHVLHDSLQSTLHEKSLWYLKYIQGIYCPKVTTSSLVVILISIFLRSAVCFKCEQLQTSSPNHLILNCDPLCVPSNTVMTCPLHSGLSGIKYGNGTSNFVKPSWTLTRSLTTPYSPHWFSYLLSWKLGWVLIRCRLSLMVVEWLSLSQYGGGATTIASVYIDWLWIRNITTIIAMAGGMWTWVPSWAHQNIFRVR